MQGFIAQMLASWRRARRLVEAGKLNGAAELATKVLRIAPGHADALNLIAINKAIAAVSLVHFAKALLFDYQPGDATR